MKNSSIRLAISATPLLLGLFFVGEGAGAVDDSNQVTPGELVIDHPTLINLGLEWLIQGERQSRCESGSIVSQTGKTEWKVAMPLLRLQGEWIYQSQGVFDCRLSQYVCREHFGYAA